MFRAIKSTVMPGKAGNGGMEMGAGLALDSRSRSNTGDRAGTEKVFVVDDDAFIRDLAGDILRDVGWEVQSFSSCEAFLAVHSMNSKTCLVLDIRFPGMGGLELLRHMSDVEDNTPVIVISGSSGVNEAVRAMKKGALDFIEKPVVADLLVESVRRAFAMSRHSEEISAARDAALAHFNRLTTRQKQIMDLVLAGHPSKNIAADLGISRRTVESHRAAIMYRTGARSLPELARLAVSARSSPAH